MHTGLILNCRWTVQVWRKGALHSEQVFKNAVTLLGKSAILDTMFETRAKDAAWYLGLVSSANFELFEESDTILLHPGWEEFTDYSELTRPQWLPDPAIAGVSINSLPIDFNVIADGSVIGGFVVTENTIGGTTGLLWSTALFTDEVLVETGDEIKAFYEIQAG